MIIPSFTLYLKIDILKFILVRISAAAFRHKLIVLPAAFFAPSVQLPVDFSELGVIGALIGLIIFIMNHQAKQSQAARDQSRENLRLQIELMKLLTRLNDGDNN